MSEVKSYNIEEQKTKHNKTIFDSLLCLQKINIYIRYYNNLDYIFE